MTKRGVVLGGGGARGPYQIGVWRALRELGVDYSIVTGSSVGALNGALMVQGDYDEARRLWETLTLDEVFAAPPEVDATDSRQALRAVVRCAVAQGGLDITPLEHKVRAIIDEDRFRQSPVEYGLVTTRYPTFKPVQLLRDEIPPGALVDYMLASSSWFPFFRRRTIDGVDYIDGAYADNLPAELAVRCGAQEIIAIDLQGVGFVHAFRRDIPVRHIRSHWDLGDMLLFDPVPARRNMRLGYQDGLKAYRRLEGNAYAFPLGDTKKNIKLMGGALERIRRRTGVSLWGLQDQMPRIQQLLRYRGADHRFTGRQQVPSTPGRAVTTAAEITGEMLQIPPDRVYRLRSFNKLLLEHSGRGEGAWSAPSSKDLFAADSQDSGQRRRRSRMLMSRMLRILRESMRTGKVPDSFWGMTVISPAEFVAACYLLAVELHYRLLD